VVVFLVLALALALPFVIWGDTLAERLSVSGAAEWLREQGQWAWAFGCALLVGDLVLPLPSTAVRSALGAVYGPWNGGAIFAARSPRRDRRCRVSSATPCAARSDAAPRSGSRDPRTSRAPRCGFARRAAGSSRSRVGCRFSPRWSAAWRALPACPCARSSSRSS